ncbi:substrate-binding domain-containing protein [Thalassotalea euphylliae]|uniref:substrate-binding domain-containing protein n=1 Tax=Thalassotalea euphylliae TaxID=1655234 RepID=UPI00362F8184
MMRIFLKTTSLLALLLSFSSVAEVAVIVNSNNADNLDAKTIKRIYLGKSKSFPSGTKVQMLSLPDSSSTTSDFREKALGKSNSQYKSYWSKLAFTGKGTPPKEMANDNAMVDAVKADPGAIGFVDSGSVTGDVKVVATF